MGHARRAQAPGAETQDNGQHNSDRGGLSAGEQSRCKSTPAETVDKRRRSPLPDSSKRNHGSRQVPRGERQAQTAEGRSPQTEHLQNLSSRPAPVSKTEMVPYGAASGRSALTERPQPSSASGGHVSTHGNSWWRERAQPDFCHVLTKTHVKLIKKTPDKPR